jgi:pyruvate-formate lyase
MIFDSVPVTAIIVIRVQTFVVGYIKNKYVEVSMKNFEKFKFKSTERVEKLLAGLYEHANTNRSSEWFEKGDFENIGEIKAYSKEPVIIRKARAINEMLTKMTDENISKRTLTYRINDGELIVGVLPMGSNGLGKVFPNYLTQDEQRVASFTNRTELSLLGHNTVNYENLLSKGLDGIIAEAKERKEKLKSDREEIRKCKLKPACKEDEKCGLKPTCEKSEEEIQYSIDFYEAVEISCKAVAAYSLRFADLAGDMAGKLTDPKDKKRKDELLEIERICRKVPMKKPESFHEALQSIYTFHVALHASLNLLSLGRLDQVLMKYIDKNKANNKEYIGECTELFECFLIKAASRLNLTTEFLLEQDHMDNNAALGTHPYYLDQRAGANNFLQNIIVGGRTPEDKDKDTDTDTDATNQMTYIILNAFENVNLSTPGIYVRLHKDSDDYLKSTVAEMLSKTKNLPGLLNDEVLIPALYDSLLYNEVYNDSADVQTDEEKAEYKRISRDYCVDGCWEPILNGISDWTFGMVGGMDILQCALNRGATLDTNPGMLRGAKKSLISKKITDYASFQTVFKEHMKFFIDQSTFGLYEYYMLDEFINPSPLYSSVLGTCMERGRDKSWGGTKYNIGGTILIGIPDMINTIAAIKKWVFDRKKYKLQDVLDAMRDDFKSKDTLLNKKYGEIRTDFDTNSPKFGNDDDDTNRIGDFIVGTFCDAVKSSKKLTDGIFLKPLDKYPKDKQTEIIRLRRICGYYGESLQEKFGKDFNIRFTAGCGTFEQYPLQGKSVVASPDRDSGDPLAPNLSPYPGTVTKSAPHILESLKALNLKRMAAGAITDLCIDDKMNDVKYIMGIIDSFISNNGSMMTLAIGNRKQYEDIYQLSETANGIDKEKSKEAFKKLQDYRDVNVRVGGWQAPFITMSLEQQKNYTKRIK